MSDDEYLSDTDGEEDKDVVYSQSHIVNKKYSKPDDDDDDAEIDVNSDDDDDDDVPDKITPIVDVDADIDDDDIDVGSDGDSSNDDDSIEVGSDDESEVDNETEDDENPIVGGVKKADKTTAKVKKVAHVELSNDNDDDDDDDEYEENYLQKFDNEVNNNYISEFHPECLNHNSDEVSKLSKIVRDENNIIIDQLHKTLPYLTKYEKARILGQRAKQIETGSKPLVKVPENIIDSYVIAEFELREKKIPFIIKRPIPGGAFEYWHVNDLENINF